MKKLLAIPLLIAALSAAPCRAQSLYGAGKRCDSLSNVPLNGTQRFSITFVAQYSLPIKMIRTTSPIRAGYTTGTGGNLLFTLEALDGGTQPQIGFLTRDAVDPYADVFPLPLHPLVEGQIYTLVIQNVADDPVNNWRSLDGLVVNTVDDLDVDTNVMMQFPGAGWQANTKNTPIFEIVYTNGRAQGQGYLDCLVGAGRPAGTVRQMFTPSKNLLVSGGAISVQGMTSEGTVALAGQTVPLRLPSIPNGWARFDFPNPVQLLAGTTYYLAPNSTGTIVPMQEPWTRASNGLDRMYTFSPDTYFSDGCVGTRDTGCPAAQQLVNGVWGFWVGEQGSPEPNIAMPFFLEVE